MSYHSTGNRRNWNGRGLGKVRGGEWRWNSSECILGTCHTSGLMHCKCGILISAKLIYGISMHVIYCSCVNGLNLDQSLVILHNWRRVWDPK